MSPLPLLSNLPRRTPSLDPKSQNPRNAAPLNPLDPEPLKPQALNPGPGSEKLSS